MTSFERDHSILTGLERALDMSLQPLREIAEREMEYDDFAAMAHVIWNQGQGREQQPS